MYQEEPYPASYKMITYKGVSVTWSKIWGSVIQKKTKNFVAAILITKF